MTPAIYNFKIRKGADIAEAFQVLDAEGIPLNLTGFQIVSQIRKRPAAAADLIAEFVVSVPDPLTGQFFLTLLNSVTSLITEKVGYFDILLIDPIKGYEYYCEGKISFTGGISVTP